MELTEAMRTQHACRYYAPDPVSDEVLYNAVEVARFGPQGGNRQPVRFVIVRDEAKKKQLSEWYNVPWKAYYDAMQAGVEAIEAGDDEHTEKATWIGHAKIEKAMADANHFAQHFAEHPAIIVVCADLAATHPTDTELDRLSIVGGASVYPTTQNLCLALRNQGVATTFTTLLVAYEKEVKELLGIPEEYATAAHIVAGYPAKPFPKKLTRLSVEELAFVDTFGDTLTAPAASAA
jgi:nitroreductase